MELNKFAAALLLAGIFAMISGIVADTLYSPELSPQKRGFSVAVTEEVPSDEGPKKEEVIDIKALMAKADTTAGEKTAKACSICHNFEKTGANKVGPALWGVVGANKGHRTDFGYSKGLKEKGGTWDYDSLFHMIHRPREFIDGTKMSFAGLKNYQDVANVIAYLRTLSDTPVALP